MNVRYVIRFVHRRKGDRDSIVFCFDHFNLCFNMTINKYNLSYYT